MLRNRELRRFAVLFLLLAVVSAAAGFAVGRAAGILAVLSAAAFGTAFFVFTRARYQSIARISEQIDLVLHNAEHLYISQSEEGELSILSSEITKMTLRIREQNAALKREKEHLAESLADVAHQLRTPLTSATLILSLLEQCGDREERGALIREAEGLFVQMDWLLTALLKLSRLDAGIVVFQRETVDVYGLVRSALRPLQIPLELHGVDVSLSVPEGVCIAGDPGWLSEALQNILKNCMESAGDNGRLEIGCEDNALYTQIEIHDSGPGFDREELPRLFDRFYRGKNTETAGFGIGLALSRTIITRQGGTLSAKNHPEGGAVFAIRFPK